MYMNLLKETIKILEENNKTVKDVLWIGTSESKINWSEFEILGDFNYDSGFGGAIINSDLIVRGKGFWLERHEYDGSEWWEFKTLPKTSKRNGELKLKNDHWYDD